MPTPPPVPLTGGVDWGRAWHAAFDEAAECARLDEELAKVCERERERAPRRRIERALRAFRPVPRRVRPLDLPRSVGEDAV